MYAEPPEILEIKGESNRSLVPGTQCLNCACELAGPFCHECGQSASVKRYSLKSIGNEIYQQFRKVDALTTLRTFWQLTRQPGKFVTAYLGGQQVGFLAPVKYFFYSFVVQILVGSWLFWITNDHSLDHMSHVGFQAEIIMFISTVFWGILWRLFYRKSGHNVVENMVAALFFVGQSNFFGIILQLVSFPLLRAEFVTVSQLNWVELIGVLAYSFYFTRNFFRESYLLLIPKQLVLSLLYVILVIVISVGAFSIGAMTDQLKNLK